MVNLPTFMLMTQSQMTEKQESCYALTPPTVSSKKGSMVTMENEERSITRNSSFFQTINHQPDAKPVNGSSVITSGVDKTAVPARMCCNTLPGKPSRQ